MNRYETLFIIKPDSSEDQIQSVMDRLQTRIERTRGKVAAIDYWGQRLLAYPVRYRGEKIKRGFYVLLTYVGGGDTVEEVERNIKILDPAFRYLTVKLGEDVDPASITEMAITGSAKQKAAGTGEAVPAEPRPAEPAKTERESEAGPSAEGESKPGEPGQAKGEAGPSAEGESKPGEPGQAKGEAGPSAEGESKPGEPGQAKGEAGPSAEGESKPGEPGQVKGEAGPSMEGESKPGESGQGSGESAGAEFESKKKDGED